MESKEQRKLDSFCELKKKWIELFCGKHQNSICNQLHDLSWYLTVFYVINESRNFSKTSDGKYENNGMLHNFIDKCFFEYVCVALRRLLDKDSGKSTCSLFRLIADMENHHHLITRKIYFEAYGQEYDVEKIRIEHEEYCQRQNGTYTVPQRLIWEVLERRHVDFDTLSGVNKKNRNKNDIVKKDIFTNILNKLKSFDKDVIWYTDKFIAHIERPDRQQNNQTDDDILLTYGRVCEAHEVICKIATLVGRLFLEFPGPFLGTVVFDQFENINLPFVKSEHTEQLKPIWLEKNKQINDWSYIDIEHYKELVSLSSSK